jgi:hypothetical protein
MCIVLVLLLDRNQRAARQTGYRIAGVTFRPATADGDWVWIG